MSLQRFPAATWAPIPEAGNKLYVKTQLIFHSTGTKASASANRRYFAAEGVQVESTFIVDYDGGCLQLLEAGEKADANVSASRRAISVEVVGTADEPYTPAQVATCIAIGRWAVDEHPIPAVACEAHNRPGIGWHVMFGAPGPWTAVRGKQCPGGARIAQVRDLIIPAVAAGHTIPTDPEDDMPLSDADVERIAKRTAQHVADGTKVYGTDNLRRLLERVLVELVALPAKVAAAVKAQP